jgi:hypothetical protein
MADRMYNVAQMLLKARQFRNEAQYGSAERKYFDRECYKWENELMSNNINPDSIESFEFKVQHGFFDDYPALALQAQELYLSSMNK